MTTSTDSGSLLLVEHSTGNISNLKICSKWPGGTGFVCHSLKYMYRHIFCSPLIIVHVACSSAACSRRSTTLLSVHTVVLVVLQLHVIVRAYVEVTVQ
jgi:hypothetical protein